MKVHHGDFVLVSTQKKPRLVRITLADADGTYTGKVETRVHKVGDDPETIQFRRADIICALGKAPILGTAFGVRVEPLHDVWTTHSFFNEIHCYMRLEQPQVKAIMKELDKFYKELKSKRLTSVRPILELRHRAGKYAGYYKYYPKEDRDRMCVRPQDDLTELQYVLAHEYGHGIWYRCMSRTARLRWIRLYHSYVKMVDASEVDINRVLDAVVTAQSISSALKTVDESDVMLLKECVKQVHKLHGLNKQHLEMMLEAGESLDEYWPYSIELSEKEVAITEYARSSPEELMAECFAHWFVGRKLPKALQEGLDKTLSNLIKT